MSQDNNHDTTIENLRTRMDSAEAAISEIKVEIKDVKTSSDTTSLEVAAFKSALESITKNTDDIKRTLEKNNDKWDEIRQDNSDKWDELKRQRDKDHLENPKQRLDNLVDKIMYIIIGAFVSFILFQAFPFLK